MRHKEKIEKAKAKLMLEHPYIGALATALRLDDNPQTLTFNSDGVSLKYNDEYFDEAPLDEIMFALANGAMHAVLKHSERSGERVGRIWQAATDITVNTMLLKNGFTLPPYAYYDTRFDGMYAEEIYDILTEEMIYNDTLNEADAPPPDDPSDPKENAKSSATDHMQTQEPSSSQPTTSAQLPDDGIDAEEIEALRQEITEHFEQIFQKFNRQGELPQGLEMVIPHYFSHKIHWQELLYRYIAEFAKNTYSFIPPNMKYLYRGIYLPSLSSDLLRIVIAVDTSGSVDESLLGTFLGEVESIMQSYGNYEIDLITADAKVQAHRTYLPGERLDYTVSGGGGTDFRPTFAYIDAEISYPTLLLYFTDGMGTFPEVEPSFDVMWVMPEVKEVPFGEVLVLDE